MFQNQSSFKKFEWSGLGIRMLSFWQEKLPPVTFDLEEYHYCMSDKTK